MTKINGQLGGIGKAAVNYTGSTENLKITVNAGNTIDMVAGPTNFDALSRLGISAGTLSAPATGSKSTTSTTTKGVTPTYGLGLTATAMGPLDISTKTGADLARAQLLSVLSSIQSTYQTTNAPPPSTSKTGNTSGTANAATTSQLANYSAALGLMNANTGNAAANIQQIVAQSQQQQAGGGSSGTNSLLSALSGLGG